MGKMIVNLLELFKGRVPDAESNRCVLELAKVPERWSAGHAVFDEIRRRLAGGPLPAQYYFEESCCQALYNASEPLDSFDPSSAFFVAPFALIRAPLVDVPLEAVATVLTKTL